MSTASGFGAGTAYRGFFDVKLNDADDFLVLATVDDPTIAGTLEQALVLGTRAGGGGLGTETLVAVEGDVLPGQVEALATFGTSPHTSDYNDAGDLMFVADLLGSTATDVVCYLNSTVVAQEGSPSPAAGRNWALSTSTTAVSLNDAGGWALRGGLDGVTTSNTLIVKNGVPLVQEGDSLPAIAPFSFTSLGTGPIHLANDGTLAWYGEWDDPDGDVNSGLFLDEELVIQEGVTMVGGQTIDTLRGITDGFSLSPGGRYLLFEAVLNGSIEGAFLLDRGLVPQPFLASASASGGFDVRGDAGSAGKLVFLAIARREPALPARALFQEPLDWHLAGLAVLDARGRAAWSLPALGGIDIALRVLPFGD